MTVSNPYYDPQWEAKYDIHHERRSHYQELERNLRFDSPEREEARNMASLHHDECIALFRSQFPTVEKYAEWLIKNLPEDASYIVPDTDKFTSIEAASAEVSRIRHEIDRRFSARPCLPRAQPKGLRAFSDSATAASTWRTFSPESLGDGHGKFYKELKCVVTFDEIDGVYHICLSFNDNESSPGVIAKFENIATALRQEISRLPSHNRTHGFLGGLLRSLAPTNEGRRFIFYLYTAANTYAPESFDVVGLTWTNNGYCTPEWQMIRYDSVPPIIAEAPFNLAMVAAPRPLLLEL